MNDNGMQFLTDCVRVSKGAMQQSAICRRLGLHQVTAKLQLKNEKSLFQTSSGVGFSLRIKLKSSILNRLEVNASF